MFKVDGNQIVKANENIGKTLNIIKIFTEANYDILLEQPLEYFLFSNSGKNEWKLR